ncbi:hypothetical protein NC652_026903 [Populus alba x Populus x berolinensis]|nr:hypothetical protein NC652_026903 [Populus alba x Populus x berolinensis]
MKQHLHLIKLLKSSPLCRKPLSVPTRRVPPPWKSRISLGTCLLTLPCLVTLSSLTRCPGRPFLQTSKKEMHVITDIIASGAPYFNN